MLLVWSASLRAGRPVVRRARHTLIVLSLAALASCRATDVLPSVTPDAPTLPLFVERGTAPLLNELVAAYPGPGYLVAWDIQSGDAAAIQDWLTINERGYALTMYTSDRSARDPWADYWATPVGKDAVAVIVHVDNPIRALSAVDLRAILAGYTADWSAVEVTVGERNTIDLVVSSTESATSRLIQGLLLDPLRLARRAQVAFTPEQLLEAVGANVNAVSYVSAAWLSSASAVATNVRSVPIDGAEAANAESYPLQAPLVFLGAGEPDDSPHGQAYRSFFAWVQGAEGQAIVMKYTGGL